MFWEKTQLQVKCNKEKKEYLSTKDIFTFMKETQKKKMEKKLSQQCVTMGNLKFPAMQKMKMMNTTNG